LIYNPLILKGFIRKFLLSSVGVYWRAQYRVLHKSKYANNRKPSAINAPNGQKDGSQCKQPNTAQTLAALPLIHSHSHRWNW